MQRERPTVLAKISRLTVRFLETRTSTTASEFFGLAATRVGNKQRAVVPQKHILDLLLRLLIYEFLVISDECFGDALSDCVDLWCMASSLHADAHVHTGEFLTAQQQDRLERLVPQNLRLHQLNGTAIDLDQASPPLAVCHGHRRLLAAKALHRFHCWKREREKETARCERATTHSNELRNAARGKANTRRRRGHGALAPLLPQTLTLNIKLQNQKKS